MSDHSTRDRGDSSRRRTGKSSGHHSGRTREQNSGQTLIIGNPESASVDYEVYSPHQAYYTNGTILPLSHISVRLPSSLTVSSDRDRKKGVRVSTTDPSRLITVSGLNYQRLGSADAFLAIPTNPGAGKYTYIISSMQPVTSDGMTSLSLVLIVGTQNNTLLTITPTTTITIPTDIGGHNNEVNPRESCNVTLNKLETYQIESHEDLTGSVVVSNKPLSVFAGHQCGDIPVDSESCGYLVEQIPPTSTWGRSFFLVQYSSWVSSEWYRIVSSEPLTTLSITCSLLENSLHTSSHKFYIAIVGGFKQFQMERHHYCYLSADKPVLVMQYAYGSSTDDDQRDPFMTMIVPSEQYVSNATINFYAYEHFHSKVTVVMLKKDVPTSSDILLDNIALDTNWVELYCSEEKLCGYTLSTNISNGFHFLKHLNSTIPLAVYVYGSKEFQSYGYPAAVALRS